MMHDQKTTTRDRLIRDYHGVAQVRHNGRHFYCTGRVALIGYFDDGLTIPQAIEASRDESDPDSWGFVHPDLREFCKRWEGACMRYRKKPVTAGVDFWPGYGLANDCARHRYTRIKRKWIDQQRGNRPGSPAKG